MKTDAFVDEVSAGQRFEFGKNWQQFLSVLNDERIRQAEQSLLTMLEVPTLAGKSFLDIGCGSGLFSLAAIRLGAERVHSFDFDPQSAACAEELKRRYFPSDGRWTVERGSALDEEYLRQLGEWDVVYSWGVLHHTGDMWRALANASLAVRPGGVLFISIYNDQGRASVFWKRIKRLYNETPSARPALLGLFFAYWGARGIIGDLMKGINPLSRYMGTMGRGMSYRHDVVDWIGGYPFEVASPAEIFAFFKQRGFTLLNLRTAGGGYGCNEYVFAKQ